jgi:integrase
MSVLAECPKCRRKQSAKNKLCKCGQDLDKAKRGQRVKYWISFRLPGGKQRREPVSFSIEEARDADGKRRSQKREGRIFDMLPESKLSFNELAGWYLNLKSVKKLASYDRITLAINNFNKVLGDRKLNSIKQTDIEDYQDEREGRGIAFGTIDLEVNKIKTMVIKAFDNDLIDGRILKPFRMTKRKLQRGENARKRLITITEYLKLIDEAKPHFKAVLIVAFNTGLRTGELKALRWSYIDRKNRFIRLPPEIPKEGKEKNIPINRNAWNVLNSLPRALKHDFVFTYLGQPLTCDQGFKQILKNTCKRAIVPYGQKTPDGIIFHDIRRTVKTNMLNAGMDKPHRDTILGHSLKGMDAHYIVPTDESLTRAMDKYTKWFDREVFSANVDQTVDQSQLPGR